MTAVPAPTPAAAGVPAAAGGEAVLRPVITVTPGQVLAARVIAAGGGTVELALAGQRLVATSDLPLEPGRSVRLTVSEADDARVVLRLTGETPAPAGTPAARGPLAAPAAAVLADALAARGMPPDAWRALLDRASAAGVRTPVQAAAFARLELAGLPAVTVTVGGLADVADGPPLGRLLSLVATPASPSPAALTPSPAATPAPPGQAPAPQGAPVPQPPPVPGRAAVPAPAPTAVAVPQPPAAAPQAPAPASANPAAPSAAPTGSPAPPAGAPAAPPPAPAAAHAAPAAAAPEALTRLAALVTALGGHAVSGDAARVREAVRMLGQVPDAPRGPSPAAEATLRAVLLEAAAAPDVPAGVARIAERAADAVVAQALVPPALAQTTDPAQLGAYLQMPLPGGQTAEVRVLPDGGRGGDGPGEGEGGVTRIAFLLHLSALGPVVVEAVVSPTGVDAFVRSGAASARAFLSERAPELAEGLARAVPDGRPPRVSVERMTGPPPRALGAPPSPGLDLSA